LEGKIEEQSQTKKMLRDLFVKQIKSQNIEITPELRRWFKEIDESIKMDSGNDSDSD
jgi:hypothetical protein